MNTENQETPQVNEVGEITLTEKPEPIRRGKHGEWVLEGYTEMKNLNPKTRVPIWRYDWDAIDKASKYPCAKLRELRAERGVGSSKNVKRP